MRNQEISRVRLEMDNILFSTVTITGLARGYPSQSSTLYGVLEASEHSLYAFLSRFDAIGLLLFVAKFADEGGGG